MEFDFQFLDDTFAFETLNERDDENIEEVIFKYRDNSDTKKKKKSLQYYNADSSVRFSFTFPTKG